MIDLATKTIFCFGIQSYLLYKQVLVQNFSYISPVVLAWFNDKQTERQTLIFIIVEIVYKLKRRKSSTI